MPRDEFCWFIEGEATYVRDTGETVEVKPSTAVHFPAGWRGRCTVRATMRNTYMLSREATPGAGTFGGDGAAQVLADPQGAAGRKRDGGLDLHAGLLALACDT
ncbi:MAG: cupin domain-containing protein [Rhizobiaceae bacterium]|nr:cupin domain-containing protein [Rhizobiaceae bacterium]